MPFDVPTTNVVNIEEYYGTLRLKAIKILRSRAGSFGKRTASRGSGLVSRGGTWYDLLLNTGDLFSDFQMTGDTNGFI